jgi:purine nucleosidase
MPTRVILDTDIGTDVDDCLALSLILQSPELTLDGVTCVYGDVLLRARMVLKLLQLHGLTGVPVLLGAAKPLLGLRTVYWPGHEGEGLLEPGDNSLTPTPGHAVDFIVDTVRANPGQIHLIAIGPLTNIALAFLKEPELPQLLAHLTIMGGAVRGPERTDLPYAEHNVVCDADAAHVVLTAGAPTTLVPLDVTTRVKIRRDGVARIRAAGTPFHQAIAEQVDRYPRFRSNGETPLHDPLAVATVIQPDLITFRSLHVDVETSGRLTTGATLVRDPTPDLPANTQVALTVDAPRFEAFLISRLEI